MGSVPIVVLHRTKSLSSASFHGEEKQLVMGPGETPSKTVFFKNSYRHLLGNITVLDVAQVGSLPQPVPGYAARLLFS